MHEETRYLLGLVGAVVVVVGALVMTSPAAQQVVCNPQTEECVTVGGGGSAEVSPNIGRCVYTENQKRWQCLPSHPVFPDPEYFTYEECLHDTTETSERCLRQWSERVNFEICGPTAPGTGSRYIPGSGRVEVPYQNGAARELNRAEAAFQCANEVTRLPRRTLRYSRD